MQDVTKETGLPCSSNWFCFGSLAAQPLQAASKKSETSGGMDSALPTFETSPDALPFLGVTSSAQLCSQARSLALRSPEMESHGSHGSHGHREVCSYIPLAA